MDPAPTKWRDRLILRARRRLERVGEPRLMMTWILLGAGVGSFLASVALLEIGVTSMAWRYPLDIAVGYLIFLWLLGSWLRRQLAANEIAALALAAGVKQGVENSTKQKAANGKTPAESHWVHWGGGGSSGGSGVGDGVAFVLVLIFIAVITSFVVAIFLIVTSPTLLAELLVDGAVLAALPKRFSGDPTHWLRTAIRKTLLPAVVLAAVFCLVGLGLQSAAPGAHTMGEVLHRKFQG